MPGGGRGQQVLVCENACHNNCARADKTGLIEKGGDSAFATNLPRPGAPVIRRRDNSAQLVQRDETFAAIGRFHGRFVADGLDVQRSHQLHHFNSRSKAARVSGLTWCSMPSASIRAVFFETPSDCRNATTVSCRCLLSSASLRPASVRKIARYGLVFTKPAFRSRASVRLTVTWVTPSRRARSVTRASPTDADRSAMA